MEEIKRLKVDVTDNTRWRRMKILGKGVMFSTLLYDKTEIPEGLYMYELEEVEKRGKLSLVTSTDIKTHFGTVVSKYPFECTDEGILLDWDQVFLSTRVPISIQEYIECNPEEWD